MIYVWKALRFVSNQGISSLPVTQTPRPGYLKSGELYTLDNRIHRISRDQVRCHGENQSRFMWNKKAEDV